MNSKSERKRKRRKMHQQLIRTRIKRERKREREREREEYAHEIPKSSNLPLDEMESAPPLFALPFVIFESASEIARDEKM
jgi:hypothetical protein